ncbi:hypothetical protein COV18_06870 [Candidatus Woesearchaeota archaeon CG10_big_fil_rev_8_21_14_0_10_37_12]|nr:MAG: hypothetical protein COV18_06870 [Candidatus Woesearchaeota archaeon CG10_big_fil_rev_8_21_14_0_10_37_12]
MMTSIDQILGNPISFLERVFAALDQDGIDVADYECDHICYRVETNERYQELKAALGQIGKLLIENEINGRLISTFKLNEPIRFRDHKIWCVELPSPKSGKSYKEGYEHVEFAIGENPVVFRERYPALEFDESGLHKELDGKQYTGNPDVARKYDGLVVKFHERTIEEVIKRDTHGDV